MWGLTYEELDRKIEQRSKKPLVANKLEPGKVEIVAQVQAARRTFT